MNFSKQQQRVTVGPGNVHVHVYLPGVAEARHLQALECGLLLLLQFNLVIRA